MCFEYWAKSLAAKQWVQKVWMQQKKYATSWIWTHDLLSTLSVDLWFSEECGSSFLYTFVLNSLGRANGSTHELMVRNFGVDDEHFMLGTWWVKTGSPMWVIGETERQTDGFSALYRLLLYNSRRITIYYVVAFKIYFVARLWRCSKRKERERHHCY